jgi:predicted metal-dependent hydrolase
MVLRVRPDTGEAQRREIVEEWFRGQLRQALPPLIAKWEPRLGVKVGRVFVQRMRTRWGSCNAAKGNIRLNTDLAKKPPECLEYILVHEMIHLLEPTHSKRFLALMDQFMPKWQFHRASLNRLPVRHENWIF